MVNAQGATAGLFTPNRLQASASAQNLLAGIGGSQAVPGFQDLLSYFLQLEDMARRLATQQSLQASSGTLLSAPLHLNIRIENYSHLTAAEAGGTLPLESQTLETEEGAATRVAMRTPEIGADGKVTYNVAVLKLAVSLDALSSQPDLAQSMSLGQPLVPAVGASAGQSLSDFMNGSGFAGGPGQLVWEYSSDNAAASSNDRQKMLEELYAMANALMDYLNQQEILHAFDISAQEKKRIEEMLKQQQIAAEKAAIIADIKKKQIAVELAVKDLLKRRKRLQEAEELAQAKSLHHRLSHFLGSTEKLLEQPNVDPATYAGLLEQFHHLTLELKAAAAAQTSVPVTTAN